MPLARSRSVARSYVVPKSSSTDPKRWLRLKEVAADKADGHPLLRIYWYDGALGRGLSPEHELLADSHDIKLRLGAISYHGKQKGVDSLVVADLIDLARNQAISDAVLLSGDEDTRIGVQIAQSLGVRIHLVGVKVPDGNQSRSLKQESDTSTEWSGDDVIEFLTRLPTSEVGSDEHVVRHAAETDQSDHEQLEECGASFVESRSPEELSTITDFGPNSPVPPDLDRLLLRFCRDSLQRWLNEPEKLVARRLLREHLKTTPR